MSRFDRITHKPDVMGGKACIRGMRVTVAMVVNQVGAGRSIDDILRDYPYLEREDILQALRYAAWLAEGQEMALTRQHEQALAEGAVLTLDPARMRVRLLPMGKA